MFLRQRESGINVMVGMTYLDTFAIVELATTARTMEFQVRRVPEQDVTTFFVLESYGYGLVVLRGLVSTEIFRPKATFAASSCFAPPGGLSARRAQRSR